MKLLFIHEGYISRDNNKFYSLHYDNNLINRYKIIADEITFLTREEDYKTNHNNQNILNVEGFKFTGIENYRNSLSLRKYKKAVETIKNAVIETDYLVARLPGDMGNIAIKYAKEFNKPYIIELVGCAYDALTTHSLLGKIIAPALYFKTRKIVKEAPHVIYVTSQFLQKRYPTDGKSTNASNVSLTNIVNNSKDINIRNKNKIVLGTIGPVNLSYKGHKYVIEAISKLKSLGYEIEYQLVGGGDPHKLKKNISENKLQKEVKIIGPLPHNEIFDWLKKIDLYIQPSDTEGLPRSLIEAMSMSCICIGSNAGGIPELLPKSNIFNKGDVNDLVDVLVRAFTNGSQTIPITYAESLKYQKQKIEQRRSKFLVDFANRN